MRLLHTSDWHLGATLEHVSRSDEHRAFLSWLRTTVEEERIDLLVVAGDVFDGVQPSAEALGLFYGFLASLRGSGLKKTVIVGGNHDSASRLEAPREVLDALDVQVVGGYRVSDDPSRYVCPVVGASGEVELVVIALPFVHEARLGICTTGAEPALVHRQFEDALAGLYRSLADHAVKTYGELPLVATGHLTCAEQPGSEPCRDDYPYEINQVGTLGALSAEAFDPRFRYVALGHIHRSYRVGKSRAWYCGSPLPLSITEANRSRRVIIADLAESEPAVRYLDVPLRRELVALRGDVGSLSEALAGLEFTTAEPPLVYLTIEVEQYDPTVQQKIREETILKIPLSRRPTIVDIRQVQPSVGPGEVSAPALLSLKDLEPEEVFVRLCRQRQIAADERLLTAFREVSGEAHNPEAHSPEAHTPEAHKPEAYGGEAQRSEVQPVQPQRRETSVKANP